MQNTFRILVLVIAVGISSCAHFKRSVNSSSKSAKKSDEVKRAQIAQLTEIKRKPKKKFREESAIERIESLGLHEVIQWEEPNAQTHYDNSRYDFPITYNYKVEGWIDYFTGRGRRHFERYLARSGRYIPILRQTLRQEGVPEDLVYVAMIESGFNVRARSWASAVGPWQFIRGTGRRYGLKINNWVDERRDPVRSSLAAARYFKDLYLMFESWYLAAAGYNAGEYKILRAIEKLKTHNFWAIAKTRYIRQETKDYVPKVIAAAIISKNPERYGFDDIDYMDPLSYDTVNVKFPVRLRDIAGLINANSKEISDLNPHLYRNMVPPGQSNYDLRVPTGSRALVERALIVKRDELAKPVRPVQYRVRRGDTLIRIARRFGVRLSDLLSMNNIKRRHRIYPGRRLMIPKFGTRTLASRKRTKSRRVASKKGYVTHIVRRGESLWSIAVKHNVTVQDLFRWNNLKRSRIMPGKRLKVRPKTASL